jgi:hypothetical protein
MAESLNIKAKENCRWDLVSLGEVMLRLDPGEGRIHTTLGVGSELVDVKALREGQVSLITERAPLCRDRQRSAPIALST